MRRLAHVLLLGLLALACGGLSATENPILFIGVSGYKLTERGELQPLANLPGLTVTPGEGHVYSNGDLAARSENNFAVTVPFGYRVGKWKIAFDDPFALTDGEDLAGSEGAAAVTIPWSGRGHVAYLALILEPDNNRTVTIGKTPFGAGTVGTNLGTYACQKGDVFRLNALPAHDDATGFDRSVFRRWKDGVTDARRTVTVDTNLTLIAEFVPNSWDVSFDANGGSVCPRSKRVTCDASYGWLPTPTRPGHSFVGWYSESLNGSRVVFDTTVGAIGDHSLYAHWDAASYVIGFELRGEGNGTVEGVGSFPYGTLTTLQAKPYEGSVFAGWEDGETRNPRRIDVTGDATYGARFDIATFDVTFTYRNAQGEWTVSPVQKVGYGEAAVPPDESAYDSWPEHHFRNWSTEDYKSVKSGLAGEHSVQAIYDVQTYKVTFVYNDRDGNAVTTMPQHVEAGNAAVPPKDDVANNWIGHTRTGWKPDYSVIGSDLTVTADYELRQYDVTFVYTDGSGKEAKTVEPVSFGETVPFEHVESLKTQWSGHTFKYWSLGNRPVTPPVVVSNNLHIAAVYEGYAHISYDANGSEGEMPTQVYTNFIGQVELASNAFTKTGYEFTHWSMDESTETFKDRAVVMLEDGSAYDLKANWAPIEYTVAFDGNGGTWTSGPKANENFRYDEGRTIYSVGENFLTRDGYDLRCWSTNRYETGAGYPWAVYLQTITVSNLTTVANDVVTFYAIWTATKQTISVVGVPGTTNEFDVATGESFREPDEPLWPGHVFGGWETNGVRVTFPIVVPPNGFTLTALWTPIAYSVRFHGNGGTGEMDDQAFVYGEAPKPLAQNAFEIAGQTFNGWTNASGKVYADGALVSNLTTNNGEIVGLWATWTPNRYTVKFLPGAGTGTMSDQDFRYDEPKALTSNGFTAPDRMVFDCWTNAAAQEAYADGAFVSNLTAVAGGVVELMALWKVAPSYIVAFRGEGGTNETGAASYEQTIECGKATALTANRFARTGYGFAGWAAGAGDGSTVVHTNGEFVTDLAAEGTTKDLYAAWTPNHFTVVFDGNGADDGSMEPQDFTYGVEQALTPNGFTRTGHTFANWTNETGDVFADGAKVTNLTDEADGEVTLFATWTVNRYEIRYDSAGGSAVNVQSNDYGAATSVPQPPTKTGYTFAGWYDGETPFAFGEPMPAENLVLTAHWTPNSYTVKFLPGEGTGTMSDQDFRYDEPNALTPNGFTAPNQKIFDCWTNAAAQKTYADGALVSNLTTVAGGVVELTACWADAPSYTVAFEGAGGTNETGAARYEQRVECGKATALTANRFARTGYGFAGWAAAEDGGSTVVYTNGEVVTDLAPTNGTAKLYATWTPNSYTVKFLPGEGGDGTMADQPFTYDVEQALTSNAFTKTGHSFACWTNEAATGMSPPRLADGEVVSNLTAKADGEVTLWATWTVNRYEIRYDSAGGSAVNVQSNDYGAATSAPTSPTKTGYAFAGWYDGETPFSFGDPMPDHDIKLTAHWTKNGYTVEFLPGHGSGTVTSQMFAYGEAKALAPCGFTPPGGQVFDFWYGFEKWDGADKKSQTNLVDCAVVSNLTSEANGKVVLTARWKVAPSYTVAFEGNGSDGGSMGSSNFECGKGGTLPANAFTRTGYTFDQWTNKANGVTYADRAPLTADLAPEGGTVTLSALWTPNHYTVVFNGNGATSGEMVAQEFVYDEAQALTSNAFTKTGHSFACWTNEAATGMSPPRLADKGVVSNLATNEGDVVTLSAVWTANPHTLKFDGFSVTLNYGGEIGKYVPEDPTKVGYVFGGWYAEGGKTKYKSGMLMPDKDLAFESRLTPIEYTIAFDANGGSGTMTNFPAVYDQEIVLPVCEYELKGYNFDQWTNETWGAKNPGDSIKNLTTTAGATVTFFVKWTDAKSPLSQALGTDLEVTSTGDAWTVKGDKSGVERTSESPSGSLSVEIPGPGALSFVFANTNGDPDNEMTFKFNGASFGKGILMSGNGLKTMTEAGTLEFCGTPEKDETWTLKNFHWEPAK